MDPFCGSGTFLIEAAMMAANIAPGLKREFTAESWNGIIPAKAFREARRAAQEAILPDIGEGTDLQGFDIDPGAVRHARDNARAAGVEKYIHFQQRDVKQLSHPKKYGFLITNPPYGERIEDKGQVHALYETLGENYRKLDAWSMYVITAYPDAVEAIGARPTKNRKIYNGMMKTYFYEYSGPKPPRAKRPAGEV